LRTRLREILYIGIFDSLPLVRDPMMLILLSLISFLPVFFLFLFAGINAALPALVGAIILTLGFSSLAVAQSVYFYKHWFRFQDMLVASPVSPISYALGLSLSTLISSAPAVVLALAVILVSNPNPVGPVEVMLVIAASILLWLSMLFVGYALGASTKNTRRANSLPQVLGFMIGFLPPVYYPLDLLPGWLQPLAMLIPSTHAAQLAKHYFGLLTVPLSPSDIIIGWAYLIGFAIAMAFITVRKAHWVDP